MPCCHLKWSNCPEVSAQLAKYNLQGWKQLCYLQPVIHAVSGNAQYAERHAEQCCSGTQCPHIQECIPPFCKCAAALCRRGTCVRSGKTEPVSSGVSCPAGPRRTRTSLKGRKLRGTFRGCCPETGQMLRHGRRKIQEPGRTRSRDKQRRALGQAPRRPGHVTDMSQTC